MTVSGCSASRRKHQIDVAVDDVVNVVALLPKIAVCSAGASVASVLGSTASKLKGEDAPLPTDPEHAYLDVYTIGTFCAVACRPS